MNRTEKLIDTIARLNPDAGEIGAGMLANIVAEAKAIQGEADDKIARGCTFEEAMKIMRKAVAESGHDWNKVSAMAMNIFHRAIQAAHKAGFNAGKEKTE